MKLALIALSLFASGAARPLTRASTATYWPACASGQFVRDAP